MGWPAPASCVTRSLRRVHGLALAPAGLQRFEPGVVAVVARGVRRVPDGLPEHAAEAGQPGAVGQRDDTPVDAAVGQLGVRQVAPVLRRSGVVVAANPPDDVPDGCQLQVQRRGDSMSPSSTTAIGRVRSAAARTCRRSPCVSPQKRFCVFTSDSRSGQLAPTVRRPASAHARRAGRRLPCTARRGRRRDGSAGSAQAGGNAPRTRRRR